MGNWKMMTLNLLTGRVRWRRLCCGILAGMAMLAAHATVGAQQPPSDILEFEVASIAPRERPAFANPSIQVLPGGRFEAFNVTVHDLVAYAYELERPQTVEGGPRWAASDRFDILARMPEAAGTAALSPDTVGPSQRMVQHLLAERFALVVHWEKRVASALALTLARSDGQLGPRMRPSTIDCAALAGERRASLLAGGDPQAGDQLSQCNVQTTNNSRARYAGHTMAWLAQSLSRRMGELVVDRTSLEGPFEMELTASRPVPERFRAELADFEPSAPPLEQALREQLGLRLERVELEIDVVVIDRVERPTPN
jgi:uncharacterized protein (TIGR03435 family)